MVKVSVLSTAPIQGQKTGTSGLRKKVSVFADGYYLHNWIQSLFNSLPQQELSQAHLVVGGDGRYYNKEAIDIIVKMAAANGVKKVLVGQDGILSTPAVSAIIRRRKLYGGIVLTASHNPGGPENDMGIKFNVSNGGPASEAVTNEIYKQTLAISQLKIAEDVPNVSTFVHKVGCHTFDGFEVEIIDSVSDYLDTLKSVFDFEGIKAFVKSRSDFKLLFDSMNGVTGAYTTKIFVDELGFPTDSLMNNIPKEDFGGGHPDPNLTYAKELVDRLFADGNKFTIGVASDGDGDRNMILGDHFFVTPSDSVAVIAAHAQEIPYFKNGVNGLARSMPTSCALDRVAKALGVPFYEVPTGWKFFGNLMDAGKLSICGEESFGTGSDHIREKDGIWAVLAWISLLVHANRVTGKDQPLVSIGELVRSHWKTYGRNYYSRHDYEECETAGADAMMAHLVAQHKDIVGKEFDGYKVAIADEFEYVDPVDKSVSSHQGVRFIFSDGSRIVYRLSGTGSSGATIRIYIEQYQPDPAKHELEAQDALRPLIDLSLRLSDIQKFTGRKAPTVIT
eukprot:TRINITY_DN15495_c0_g1::TRINITY_DN15495_c0_g1_i1::g.30570::m.30570 TRINITY_DN15495_c0_g1::TRINITY_DN15495_c0_g1_i1::g.30570  ORF type:complete len:562 (+),score=188.65,sp/Q9SCY0/PGMP_ARATH/62.46/0.0,PGM_PMM_I/PF02878.11/3.9e-36,PGM_PMM_III/PF02880.11/1.8e-27,PGM_PMM_II/PF02879.11/8e-14,PGM_PMM_IV/PF00408.15/2e-10,Ribosomal_S6e/PF01092.14/0.062,DUF91/PF01939.11/0.15 TRINITY_DN15495_c0_g1_i1:7-1692(+)